MRGARTRGPSLRAQLLALAAVGGASVVGLGVYVALTLEPSARELRARTSAMAVQYDSLRAQTERLQDDFRNVRSLAAGGTRTAASRAAARAQRESLVAVASRSAAVQASLLLSDIPESMRLALADAAGTESHLAGMLVESLRDFEAGDAGHARAWVARADTVRSRLTRQLDGAQRAGLADLAARERVLGERASRVSRGLAGWALAAFGLVILAIVVGQRRLYAPLAALDAGLARVARGDLETTLRVRHDDEMGRLTGHFNEMTAVLRARPEVEALRASEVRFRSLIEHSMDLISIVGPDGRFTYVSPAVTRLLGYGPEALLGQITFAYLHPDDRSRVEAAHARAIAGRATEIREEYRIRRADGTWRHFESVVTNLVGEPTVAGLVINSRDVTERREAERLLQQSEARFRTAFMTGTDAYLIVGRDDGRILEANDQFLAMYGYRRDETIGRTSLELGLWARPEERQAMLTRLAADGMVRNFEVLARRKGGETFPVLYSTAELHGEGPPLLMGVIRDVTEQRRSAAAVRSLEEQVRQAQRLEAVGRLAGGVAHDFNNILTAITGYTDLLLDAFQARDPRRDDLQQIRAAAERAAGLTRQLLAFSRKQVLQPRVLDLNEVVQGLEKMLHRLIGEDVALDVAPAAGLGAVRADPGQIEQVVLNLAVNARDAMPEGGRLTIATADVELDETYPHEHPGAVAGPYVMLAVSDTGTGMDRETRAHIFEPFFTTKEQGKGTGLGLATVHGIVAQSGGHIEVQSEPGRGSSFRIYLPRIAGTAEAATPAPAPVVASGGGETVLVAEDDGAVRDLVAVTLTQRGYRVLRAPDGPTALALARAADGRIHLLLTDIVMPGMAGRALAEALQARQPEMKVLYMSGYTDDAVVRHGIQQDAMSFLQKPFTPDALARMVRDVLDRASAGS